MARPDTKLASGSYSSRGFEIVVVTETVIGKVEVDELGFDAPVKVAFGLIGQDAEHNRSADTRLSTYTFTFDDVKYDVAVTATSVEE